MIVVGDGDRIMQLHCQDKQALQAQRISTVIKREYRQEESGIDKGMLVRKKNLEGKYVG